MQWILYKKGFEVPQIENSILEEFKEKVNHSDFVLPFVLLLRSLSYFQSREMNGDEGQVSNEWNWFLFIRNFNINDDSRFYYYLKILVFII